MARLSEEGNTSSSLGKELSVLAPVHETLSSLNDEEASMKELLEDAISLEDKKLETSRRR
eukprot:CAMPEP_0119003026 /NCGR_PEP_ID=MMETSP1176-20130426/306_1 /TAXON_ID=265551 /ORGANISM="Synedropsis recta cf, Strain CCMP1620" /LENGTH=59 /DNA_ID=CAMNT_0006954585 /DNA_START=1993 /DNA_END=2173 /DNA_ORIENTATION=-